MADDRVQVGLPASVGPKVVQLCEDTPYFGEEADVYRVAVATALALRATVNDKLLAVRTETKFRTVMTDADTGEQLPRLDTADRRLARMVDLFYPEAAGEPYRYSQYLATIGINYLHRELVERRRTLSQTIEAMSPEQLDDLQD